jgi:hypothetical protein
MTFCWKCTPERVLGERGDQIAVYNIFSQNKYFSISLISPAVEGNQSFDGVASILIFRGGITVMGLT